jgi:hypothetical protein
VTDPILTMSAVRETFNKCLYELTPANINELTIIQGIQLNVGFDPAQLKEQEPRIHALLDQLPAPFHQANGGGWWFGNACVDKNERQWGEHRDIDMLIILGLAIKRVEFCMPRDMWEVLPDGLPYFMIKTRPQPEAV